MTVDAAGSPDAIYFRRTNVPAQALGDDEVLIRVEAAGINFRDLYVLGSIHWTAPGFEGAGVIVRIGAKVTDLQADDRVFYLRRARRRQLHDLLTCEWSRGAPAESRTIPAAPWRQVFL